MRYLDFRWRCDVDGHVSVRGTVNRKHERKRNRRTPPKRTRSVIAWMRGGRSKSERPISSLSVIGLFMIAWAIIRYEPVTAPDEADVIVYVSASCFLLPAMDPRSSPQWVGGGRRANAGYRQVPSRTWRTAGIRGVSHGGCEWLLG